VATSAGVLLGIAWVQAVIGLACWVAILLLTRYVSVASMSAAVVIAASAWLMSARESLLVPICLTVLAALVIWRHKANIRRLLKGEENRFEFRRRGPAGDGC